MAKSPPRCSSSAITSACSRASVIAMVSIVQGLQQLIAHGVDTEREVDQVQVYDQQCFVTAGNRELCNICCLGRA